MRISRYVVCWDRLFVCLFVCLFFFLFFFVCLVALSAEYRNLDSIQVLTIALD